MIRIVASGDHHFAEGARWDECLRVHDWIAGAVESLQPDLVFSGGDLFDRRSTARERNAVASWLQRLGEVAPVLVTRGNHDEDLELLGRLRATHPIEIEQAASVHYLGGVAVAAMAWPRRSQLAARAGSSALVEDAARDALRDVLRGLGDELAGFSPHVPRVLLGHFMIDGAITSTGQPLIGAEMNVGLADLGLARADVTIAAHIHRPDFWMHDGAPIIYTGSPFRTAFGEIESKSILVVDVELDEDGSRRVEWRRVPTPAAPMLLVDDGSVPADSYVRGAEIRLRYEVAADEREGGRRRAEEQREALLARGAARVVIDEVVLSVTRARASEVTTASTLADKLRVYWRARGEELGAEREERLVVRAGELEEVSAA